MYGRFEMRARLPHGQGIWPAFWLRHRNGSGTAEVDIMEYFHSHVPGQTTATLHLDGRKNLSKKNRFFETPTTNPGWHTWAVDIEPDPSGIRFTFSLDGVDYHTYVDTQHNWANSVDPNATWDMALNVAIGGDWVGDPAGILGYLPNLNRCAQSGIPPLDCRADGILRAQFPTTYQVDWVRYTAP
jgi:beta-glucanase (GH16 family)